MPEEYQNLPSGSTTESIIPTPGSPEEEIQGYDKSLNSSQLAQMLLGPSQEQIQQEKQINRYYESAAAGSLGAQQTMGLQDPMLGDTEGNIYMTDPDAVMGSATSNLGRSIRAGWGDLVAGTGDSINVINAWINPSDPDPGTSVGDWMKKVGTEIQDENLLIISEDLQDLTFGDMFKTEFWTHKVARLVPYAASFMIPYAGGSMVMTKFASKIIVGAGKRGMLGTAAKVVTTGVKSKKAKILFGTNRVGGTGVAKYLLTDTGKKGLILSKGATTWSGAIGGGFAANMMEGVYLGGETYNQALEMGLTKEQAASAASDVVWDNAKYFAVDVIQYGLLFGGLGKGMTKGIAKLAPKPVPFSKSIIGILKAGGSRLAPGAMTAAVYGTIEGYSEGVQETYQEWIKYANIREEQGRGYESYTSWLREPGGEFKKEIRDIFWTSMGLGGIMGGTRGFVDGSAERAKMLQEKMEKTLLGAQLAEDGKFSDEAQMMFQDWADNIVADHIWNYNGDGTVMQQLLSQQVSEGKLTQEAADAMTKTIDKMVENYDKHAVNTTLTEEGAKQVFFREVRLERNNNQQSDVKNIFNQQRKKIKENVAKDKQQEALNNIKMEEESILQELKNEEKQLRNEIENFYLQKEEVITKEGKIDKRYKQRMTSEEIEKFTQKGEKRMTVREAQKAGMTLEEYKEYKKKQDSKGFLGKTLDTIKGVAKKGTEVGKKIFQKGKEIAKKGVETVQELRGKEFAENVKKLVKKNVVDAVDKTERILKKAKNSKQIRRAFTEFKKKMRGMAGVSIETFKKAEEYLKGKQNGTITESYTEWASKQGVSKKKAVSEEKEVKLPEEPKSEEVRKKIPILKKIKNLAKEVAKKGGKMIVAATSIIPKVYGQGNTYTLTTASGATYTIYNEDDKVGEESMKNYLVKLIDKETIDVEIELIKPIEGQENVIKIDGQLFFEFDNNLYQYKMVAKIDGKIIGTIEYRDYDVKDEDIKRAKKVTPTKEKPKTIKERIKSVYEKIKSKVKQKESKPSEDNSYQKYDGAVPRRNHEVYTNSGLGEYVMLQKILKKGGVPAERAYIVSGMLLDSFGNEAVSLAIGNTVMITEGGLLGSDFIHESGHIYYRMHEGSALINRINKLLVEEDIFDLTNMQYPELTLIDVDGTIMTVGTFVQLQKSVMNNSDKIKSDIKDIITNIIEVEGIDDTKTAELYSSLITQLTAKRRGGAIAKRLENLQQKHLLEESFVRTLEANSYGTIKSIIKDSKAQKQIEKDLIEFYKETKKLATDEEAREFLNLIDDVVPTLTLDAAMKHILLNFGKKGDIQNSGYAEINRAKKANFTKATGYTRVHTYINYELGKGLTDVQIADNVIKRIDKSGLINSKALKPKEKTQLKQLIQAILYTTNPKYKKTLAGSDKLLIEAMLKEKGIKEDSKKGKQLLIQFEEEELNDETDVNQADLHNEELKNINMPKTLTNFFKAVAEIYNHKSESPFERKKLMHQLYTLAKSVRKNPEDFIKMVRESKSVEVQQMLNILDNKVFENQHYTDAKLLQISNIFQSMVIERLSSDMLFLNDDGTSKWMNQVTMSRTAEQSVVTRMMDSWSNLTKTKQKQKRIALENIYNKVAESNFSEASKSEGTIAILETLFKDTDGWERVDTDAILNELIVWKGKQMYVSDILFDIQSGLEGISLKHGRWMLFNKKTEKWTTKVNEKAQAFDYYKNDLQSYKNLLREIMVLSRPMNYLSIVDNVTGDGISIFNNNNALHNQVYDTVEKILGGDYDKKSIFNPENNIYAKMIEEKMESDIILDKRTGEVLDNPFGITVHSGMYRYYPGQEGVERWDNGAKTMTQIDPSEIAAIDMFQYLNALEQQKGNRTIFYDQAIATFSDKSRRYYVQSIAITDAVSRNKVLGILKKNPSIKNKYIKGDKVFPYTIIKDKQGNLQIKEIDKIYKQFEEYRRKNDDLYKANIIWQNTSKEQIKNFLTSYIANKFMAQQFLGYEHKQAKNEVDYIKRLAGTIASHTTYDHNKSFESVLIKDYYVDKDGNLYTENERPKEVETWIENDAAGYILPQQAKIITEKYGGVKDVGGVYKFVYNYRQADGNTVYLKYAVQVLTPEMEKTSEVHKNIADVLRERNISIAEVVVPNLEYIDMFAHGHLVIAASESSAKLWFDGVSGKKGSQYVYDVRNLDEENLNNILNKQDELFIKGEKNDLNREFIGLDGKGLGIQLELDKQKNERYYPSQLFYNLANNMTTPKDIETLNRMLELRKNVMEKANKERNIDEGMIISPDATTKDVFAEMDKFQDSVDPAVFGQLISSIFGKLDGRYPAMNSVYNSIANGRISKKGTKMYTKGSIAYQSSSLGMGLKSFQERKIDGKNVIVSEAYIPGYLEKQGIKKGDLFLGTRIPSHGKVTTSVFIVKGFHEQLKGSPTSKITIPAEVSAYWGADLDGDAVHMNFKYNKNEIKEIDDWRNDSNEFFDLYVDLVSREDVRKEITANIEFEQDVLNVIGEDKADVISQLHPVGDAKVFKENVPTKALVGIVAALQRSLNIFSTTGVELGFEVDINGRKISKFYDNKNEENGKGNWFGLAQLLNIVLDNAKWQYADKLGITEQTVSGFVMLRRLGYSLQDVSDIYTSDITQKYFEWKQSLDGKRFVSSATTINQILGIEKKPGKKGKDFIKYLGRKLTKEESKTLTLIYNLEKFNEDVAQPVGKAFTVHQSIEKNPLELMSIVQKIEKVRKDPKRNMGSLFENPILTHALELFETMLNRSSVTDIRYTPYMQSIMEEAYNDKNGLLYKTKDQKNKIINKIISDKIIESIDIIYPTSTKSALIKELKKIIESKPDNRFFKAIKIIKNSKGREQIVLNKQLLNEFITESEIQQIRDDFNQLTEREQIVMFNIEYKFFDFGLSKENSMSPLFSDKFIQKINGYMNDVITSMQELIPSNIKGVAFITQAEIKIQEEKIKDLNTEKRLEQAANKERDEQADNYDGKMKLTEEEEQSIIIGNKKSISHGYNYNDTKSDVVKLLQPGSTLIELSPAIKRNSIDEINNLDKWAQSEGYDNYEDIKENGTKHHKAFIKGDKPIYVHTIKGKPSPAWENKRAKKAFDRYNSEGKQYMDSNELLSFKEWLKDKGISVESITKDTLIYNRLRQRYKQYVVDYNISEDFIIEKLTEKHLQKHSDEYLYETMTKLDKLDSSASNRAKHLIRKEIAQRAFEKQTKFLQEQAKLQDYDFAKPAKSDDISWLRKWMGSNNMTSKRPEIQYMINEIEKNYYNYLERYRIYAAEINSIHNALVESKINTISLIERAKGIFNMTERYEKLYGNITNRTSDGRIVLISKEEMLDKKSSLKKEEYDYWKVYQDMNDKFGGIIRQERGDFVKNIQMGDLEMFSKEGLFGLYDMRMGKNMYVDNVKLYFDIKGTQVLMPLSSIRTYLKSGGATAKQRIANVALLEKLKRKATKLKKEGKHEDGSNITLTDAEIDALLNDGDAITKMAEGIDVKKLSDADKALIEEYKRRQAIKFEHMSMDLNGALLEFVRGTLFKHGDVVRDNYGNAINLEENPFVGMKNMSVLVDSIIQFNKENGNQNAAEYLTRWWKESFLEKKVRKQNTAEKILDWIVRLTTLRFIGFNPFVAIGNLLAGKYQELRKRGGKQFVLGEKRFFKDWNYSQELLKKHRIVEYSFSDFVHMDNKKGAFGKIERASFIFMDKSENYIQGTAFLGMLTESEYQSGEISQERVRQINHKISTLHGEGYTALDSRMLGTYALGRAMLQFKKWFYTLVGDRFQPRDVDRFGEVQVGSYTTAGKYVTELYGKLRDGEISMQTFSEEYNKLAEDQKKEMGALIRGIGLAGIISLLILLLEDDEEDDIILRNLKGLSKDVNIMTDYDRFINYTIIPSSFGTAQNIGRTVNYAISGEKQKKASYLAKEGTPKWQTEAKYEVAPFSQVHKEIRKILFKGTSKKESPLIR
jgi:hypothetical protein